MKNQVVVPVLAAIIILAVHFKINAQGTVTDIDGNNYPTVIIGDQEWMAEDLRVTKYRNGEALLFDQDHNQWQQSSEGIWAYYDNDPANNNLYGKLYNWYAVIDARGLCPTGWRTPTDFDWQELEEFIDPNDRGNFNEVGKKLKSRRQVNSPYGGEYNTTEHPRWDDHPVNFGTDEYDFNALPGGGYTNGNAFRHKGKEAYYWSATEALQSHAWTRILVFSNIGISRGQLLKSLGASVRCVKGAEQTIQVPQVNTVPASSITLNSAISGGDVLSDGGAAVTARGVVWSTAQNPKIDDYLGITTNGIGLGQFTSEITGLNPGATYWVRAYATNSAGTGYGIQIKLVTLTAIGLPTVTTSHANNITSSLAVSGGNIISDGGANVTSRGVVWSTTTNPTLVNNIGFTTDGIGAGVFYSSITGLTLQTTYYVKAYATNSEGTSYGNEISFETTEEVIITTNTIIVNDTTAVAGSEVTIEVEMQNQSDIVAFQMDFVLPEGFSYVDDSYTLSDRSQNHTPGQSVLSGNVLRVLAYSAVNNTFTGNSGILFTFKLATPQTIGTWELNATNVNLTNTNFENVFDEAQSGTLTLYKSSLSPGQIAIVGYNTSGEVNTDNFAFLLLNDVSAGTIIYITDCGVSSSGCLRLTEGVISWTAPENGCTAGTLVKMHTDASIIEGPGTAAIVDGFFVLNLSGEQLIIFQHDNPTDIVSSSVCPDQFLFALTNNDEWQTEATDSHTTVLPPGLDATTSIAIPKNQEYFNNNASYDCSFFNGSAEEILSNIVDPSNWIGSETEVVPLPECIFVIDN